MLVTGKVIPCLLAQGQIFIRDVQQTTGFFIRGNGHIGHNLLSRPAVAVEAAAPGAYAERYVATHRLPRLAHHQVHVVIQKSVPVDGAVLPGVGRHHQVHVAGQVRRVDGGAELDNFGNVRVGLEEGLTHCLQIIPHLLISL